jgi:hypothetical protein
VVVNFARYHATMNISQITSNTQKINPLIAAAPYAP